MKRLYLMGLLALLGSVAMAQKPTLHTVNFESHRGESFNVYFDGNLMNRMPQGRVLVSDVTERTHEVVVVLKRPAQKAAVMQLLPGEPSVMINVVYDDRTDELSLYTPTHNRAESRPMAPLPQPKMPPVVMGPPAGKHPAPVPEMKPRVSQADVEAMIVRMKERTFDSDRLALGKVIVASSNLTARQIALLAETIDYSSSQVEFLKYAYTYCVDKANYYTTVDVLTFSSDKKKVLDYIATQK